MANSTWNPSDKTAGVTLSNLNLTAVASGSNNGVRAVDGQAAGKYYYEVTGTTWSASSAIELGALTVPINSSSSTNLIYLTASNGSITVNGSSSGVTLGFRSSGDIIGIAVDFTAKLIWFRVSPAGNWNGNAGFAPGGTGGINIAAVATPLYPMLFFGGLHSFTANFGDTAFSGAVPAGYTAGWPGAAVAGSTQARVAILA